MLGPLRQRRALRKFGKNPDRAKVRAPNVVENYEQQKYPRITKID